jgi:predicted nucleotidyltransferase component of viral defense system
MLQKKSVEKTLWDVLRELQSSDIFKDYVLVGGTALALQIGHRISEDIDLFTENDIDKDTIFNTLSKKYKNDFNIDSVQDVIVNLHIKGVKVDLVKYEYPLLENVTIEEGIKYIGKKDISAMKLAAITNSGKRGKDYVDVYYLLKEMKLKDMFDCYKRKYGQDDISHVKRSLTYFDEVRPDSWLSVKLLNDTLSVNAVKSLLKDEVKKYNDEAAISRSK